MAPTAEELLALAVAALGDEVDPNKGPAAPLARRIKLPYQRVYRWFNTNGPDYEGAMAILDAFGWLNIPEDAREQAGLPPDPLEKIERGVAKILLGQAELLARVEERRHEQSSQTRAAPKKKAASRKARR